MTGRVTHVLVRGVEVARDGEVVGSAGARHRSCAPVARVTVFATPGAAQSLRPFVEELAAAGELLRLREPVDPRSSRSARASAELAAGPAVLFEHVRGHELRIVGNVLNSHARIARGLGLAEAELPAALVAALDPARRTEPVVVDTAPCQELEVARPGPRDAAAAAVLRARGRAAT